MLCNCFTCLFQYSVLEPCLLTDVIEFHCMVSLHLSATVTAPVAVRTGCYSHWQLRSRNVLTILVGQLSEATQTTAVTQHSISSDSVIRQHKYTSLQSQETLCQHTFPCQTPGCQVILQDVRFIIVIVQHSIQALVPQVELTEWGQAAKAASPRAAPVQVAEGLQAHRTLLRGDAGILLPFSSPVRHRLEAAGAYGMASLKRAHVIRGCCWQAGRC